MIRPTLTPREDREVDQKAEVWILEDSAFEARLISEALESKCRLTVFVEGTSLIERLVGGAPELLVLDWILPGLSGLDVSRFVRENADNLQLPILMVTVNTSAESLLEGLAAGANDFVTKPFSGIELLARVETLVGVSRLARAAKAREAEYLGTVGHDLSNPLNAIMMTTELWQSTPGNAPRYVARIRRSADRMALMIRDLLDFSRGRLLDGLPMSLGSVDLKALGEDVVEELSIANPERQIRFQSSGDLVGSWDPDGLQQAISTLVGNALEHSTGPVGLDILGNQEAVLIEVHDRGPGIPPAEIPALFDALRKRNAGIGLGLGLYIVKEVARAHGGSVKVTSVANERTTFTFTLPRTTREGPRDDMVAR